MRISRIYAFIVLFVLWQIAVARAAVDDSAIECGDWACLRICQLLGVNVEMAQVHQLLPASVKGNSMQQLSDALHHLGLQSDGRFESIEDLAQTPLPIILHVNGNHYVVLASIHDHGYWIYDMGNPSRMWTGEDLGKHWDGRSLLVHREELLSSAAKSDPAPHIAFGTLLIDRGDVSEAPRNSATYVFPFCQQWGCPS